MKSKAGKIILIILAVLIVLAIAAFALMKTGVIPDFIGIGETVTTDEGKTEATNTADESEAEESTKDTEKKTDEDTEIEEPDTDESTADPDEPETESTETETETTEAVTTETETTEITCGDNHIFSDWNTVITATCMREGEMNRVCSVCYYEETKIVEKSGHNLVTIPGKAATCSETGLTDGEKCADCGEILSQQTSIAKTEHSFGGWSTATKATCQAEGKDTRSCIYCGKTESKTTEKTGHNIVTVPGRSPSCSQTGLTDGEKCADCGKVTLKREKIAKTEHSYGDWSVTTKATCKAEGKETRKCIYCNKAETKSIEKTNNHDYYIGVCKICNHVSEGSDCLKYSLSDDGTYYICTGTSVWTTKPQIIIPSTYNGKPVKEVCSAGLTTFPAEELIIMEGIEKIHDGTFTLAEITTVYLPSTLKYMGTRCFYASSIDYVYISSTGWKSYKNGRVYDDNIDLSDPHAAAVYLRKELDSYTYLAR